MNPRERILTVLRHEPPDRTPTDGWFHAEIMQALKDHYATHDWSVVLADLGVEGWADCSLGFVFEGYDERAVARPGHADGRRAIWLDANTYEDAWGVRSRLGTGDRYERWLSGPLQDADTPAKVARYAFPNLASIREPEGYADRLAGLKREGLYVTGGIENPFKRLWYLRGYENALMDYIAAREVVDAVYEPLFALYTELAVRMCRAGVDMIKVVGDVAMQDRIIMGPDAWRCIDKPYWARLIESCRAVNENVVFFFHSDGKLTDLVDDLIDVGFTVINPIQPECMQPQMVKRRWGPHITLHGCVSLQKTLPFGSVEDVRNEVETLVRTCGRDGGLVIMPSNVIQPDTPVENVIACFHAARDIDPRRLA